MLHHKLGSIEIKVSNLWIKVKKKEVNNQQLSAEEKEHLINELKEIHALSKNLLQCDELTSLLEQESSDEVPPPIPVESLKIA